MSVGIEEVLRTCIINKVACYCYRKPSCQIQGGISFNGYKPIKKSIDFSNFGKGFIAMPFNPSDNGFFIPDDISLCGNEIPTQIIEKIHTLPPHNADNYVVNNYYAKQTTPQEYTALINRAIIDIKERKIQKIVYSHPTFVSGRHDSVQIFMQLVATYKSAYIYILNLPDIGLWIGATPEILLQRHGNRAKSVALAGTRLPAKEAWDEKNKKEQQLVADFVKSRINQIAGSTQIIGPHSKRAGNVEHLITEFQFKLKNDHQSIELIQALHPTPAVCGTPQQKCLKILLETEGYDRQLYGGYIGHTNDIKDFDLYVNIRCMRISKEGAILYSGGGITAESEAGKEWEETIIKANTLKTFLH